MAIDATATSTLQGSEARAAQRSLLYGKTERGYMGSAASQGVSDTGGNVLNDVMILVC